MAKNPGLVNPDISKIIGEQWRAEPQLVKENWKELAEKEKILHAQQHPGYRYQPRRNKTGITRKPPGEDSGPCPKCGGRYIVTTSTPSTPLESRTATGTPSHLKLADMEGDHGRRASLGGQGRPPPQYEYHSLPYRHARVHEVESEPFPPISDAKRRRLNSGTFQTQGPPIGFFSQPASPYAPLPSMSGPVAGPPPYPSAAYSPLPNPSLISRLANTVQPMRPPPRPSISYIPAHQPLNLDESLRLPPLQACGQGIPSPTSTSETSSRTGSNAGQRQLSGRDHQGRSVEAMVMSIPYVNKLKVLAKISPPVPPARPDTQETRGALVAIEGPRSKLLDGVAMAVEKALVSSGKVSLKKWSDDTVGIAGDVGVTEEGVNRRLDFASYLNLMVQWHEKSAHIVQHLTTQPRVPKNEDAVLENPSAADGPFAIAQAANSTTAEIGRRVIPVALIPRGFSLTASDKFASAVPICDKYTPVDHWQWMATIWRGIVGPDLVLYVKPSTEEEVSQLGTFDNKLSGLMTVRIPEGRGLDDATERRVAFEVREWILSGTYKRGLEPR